MGTGIQLLGHNKAQQIRGHYSSYGNTIHIFRTEYRRYADTKMCRHNMQLPRGRTPLFSSSGVVSDGNMKHILPQPETRKPAAWHVGIMSPSPDVCIAEGRNVTETLEIARDVARHLLEVQAERETAAAPPIGHRCSGARSR